MKSTILFITALFSISLVAADFEETRKFSLDAKDISKLFIDCGAGYLKITGMGDSEKIFVTAKIEMDNIDLDDAERILEKYLELYLEERGSRAELVSSFEKSHNFFSSIFSSHGNVRVNLTVEVPEKMNVEIDDGSGFIEVNNIYGKLFIDDGSDYIDIKDNRGNIEIDDGSGDINIRNTKGNIEIDDGSGDIEIENIVGNINLDDGSGSIKVMEIDGTVRVDDGSGSISIRNVEEDVIIEDDGSGGLSIRDIAGTVYRYDD